MSATASAAQVNVALRGKPAHWRSLALRARNNPAPQQAGLRTDALGLGAACLSPREQRVARNVCAAAASYNDPMGKARIKVIGVGGGGGNAVSRMIQSGVQVRARTNMLVSTLTGAPGSLGARDAAPAAPWAPFAR